MGTYKSLFTIRIHNKKKDINMTICKSTISIRFQNNATVLDVSGNIHVEVIDGYLYVFKETVGYWNAKKSLVAAYVPGKWDSFHKYNAYPQQNQKGE